MHPDSLVLGSYLDLILDLPNFLNPNHVLNTLVSPRYVLTSLARGYYSTISNDNFFWILTYILREAIT